MSTEPQQLEQLEKLDIERKESTRFQYMPKPVKIIYLTLISIGIILFIMWIFGIELFGYVFSTTEYYYLIFTCFTFGVFVAIPATKSQKNRTSLPWYDIVIGTGGSGLAIFFFTKAASIDLGWVPPPSPLYLALAIIFTLICLEGGRRRGGIPLISMCLLFGLYPLFASYMPGVLYGRGYGFADAIGQFAFGSNGALGLPAGLLANMLLGFFMFAGVLMATGAGEFFLNLALGMAGHYRGGAAKVAVLSSGFFGSLTESTAANIMTTGSITIPAMKKTGFSAEQAGAIEACASGAGNLMPPVMGGIAFVIVMLSGLDYATIMIASLLPVLLYYFSLMLGVDAYAATRGLKGIPKMQLPSVRKTMKEGWVYLFILLFLAWGLVYMRWEMKTPVYASLLLILMIVALSFINKKDYLTPKKLLNVLVQVSGLIVSVFSIILPIGLILTGIMNTGMAASLTAYVIGIGGGSLFMILAIGVVASLVMGMAGMALTAFLFLAVTLVPALISGGGLNETATYLFVMYIVLMSGLTPPVCVSAFIAAGIADGHPMKTGLIAVRFGIVLFFVAFFLLFSPALIFQGPIVETIYVFIMCVIGIFVIAGGLGGYMQKVGLVPWWARPLLVGGGFMFAFPGWGWDITAYGAALSILVIAAVKLINRRKSRLAVSSA
jgi:TRAP transporter 4TM/12TM fusion protein